MRHILAIVAALFICAHTEAQSGSVKIWDGADTATVTGGALDVNATLDTTGLATSAKQDTGNASLASIDGKITAVNTGAVVIASGSLTCNAGTNLNTSALATEATLSTLNGKVTACNTGAVTVSAALPAGNNNIGDVDAIQSGTWTVQPGNTANTTPWLTSDNAITTGGYTPYTFGALVDSVQTVKGSAGTLGGWMILNSAVTVCYVQFFDTTGAVTLGTTVPTWSFGLPAGAAANVPASRPGILFANGLKIAATTTRAGSTACGTGMDVNLFYK